ncbi:MAG: LptA/OstA family protein [Verrucomicrobiota bacterium]|nr:LptA/OstA family protein [Verrucomicrobiota bacterium]
MKRLILVIAVAMMASSAFAQTAVKPAVENKAAKKTDDPMKQMFGGNAKSNEPATTEIYADQAFFDSGKNTGVFIGRVKVLDPRFNLQADKLTVFLRRGENQGLEKAIAEGNVGIVRDRLEADGKTSRSIGRADRAVYTTADGNVELTGTPRVQQGMNMNVATSAETVMILNQNGQLTTRGPSRTEIHQEAKASPTPTP